MRTNRIIFTRKIFITALFVTFLFLIGCGEVKRPAEGKEDVITVIADSSDFTRLEQPLTAVFGKKIITPQQEQLFYLKRENIEKLPVYKNKKNILIIAPLDGNNQVSKFIRSMLDSAVTESVMEDSAFVFNKYNLWADGQLVMIMTSADINTLIKNIDKEHDNLLFYFQKMSNKRLAQALYNGKYEKKNIEAKFLKNYGWMIYVQADYYLAKDAPEDNFIWLRRSPGSDMERWIFVHWIDNASPALLEPDSVTAIRNRMTKKYYRAMDDTSYVQTVKDYTTISEVDFLGRYALMTNGLWRMSDKSMGGPFISYTFYDENTKRIYMLDGSIFAPKFEKKKLIQQVDVTLQSFLTEQQVKPERKEDIMKHLDE